MQPKSFSYESMGTAWRVLVWDVLEEERFAAVCSEIVRHSEEFDRTYSRFIPDSLVSRLERSTGVVEVPEDLVTMLRWYERLYEASGGFCTPLVGNALSDMGYDASYSLRAQPIIRPVPPLPEVLRILDATHIELRERVLLDLGALGKGFFVDRMVHLLDAAGFRRFLVDGSGDVFFRGDAPIRAGLEHPSDPTLAIGVMELTNAALCASGGNRRTWGGRHHIIDPVSLKSPRGILATWVLAESAVLADALATCLFLRPPQDFSGLGPFAWCRLHEDGSVSHSADFHAEMFSS